MNDQPSPASLLGLPVDAAWPSAGLAESYSRFISGLRLTEDGLSIYTEEWQSFAVDDRWDPASELVQLLACLLSNVSDWASELAELFGLDTAPGDPAYDEDEMGDLSQLYSTVEAFRHQIQVTPLDFRRDNAIPSWRIHASYPGYGGSGQLVAIPINDRWAVVFDVVDSFAVYPLGFALLQQRARAIAVLVAKTISPLISLCEDIGSNDATAFELELIRLCWGSDSDEIVGMPLLKHHETFLFEWFTRAGNLNSLIEADLESGGFV
jgi:hypothetical protein